MTSKIVKSLDKITSNVAKKPVYTLAKTDDGEYDVVNYYTKQRVYPGIPCYDVAYKICETLNKGRAISSSRYSKLRAEFERHRKLIRDAEHYKHILENTPDNLQGIIAEDRYYTTTRLMDSHISSMLGIS